MIRSVFIFTVLFFLPLQIYANELKDLNNDYIPEYCEFDIVFPEEPYKTIRCEEDNPDKCYEHLSYTQVYDMAATVKVTANCSPVTQDTQDYYTEDVMRATLAEMVKSTVAQTRNTGYTDNGEYRHAGLVGEGMSGMTPMIYVAQIWIGEKSAMSIEAELIGEPHESADKTFSEIMQSIQFKGKKQDSRTEAEPKTESENPEE